MYECGFCEHRCEDIGDVKEHMKGHHEDEFYNYCFDEWAESCIDEINEVIE